MTNTSPLRIAIIGDRFMQPTYFQQAIEVLPKSGRSFEFRHLELDWPDTPFIHGTPGTATAGLREFLGDPAEMAAFIGDAQVLVTHLSPVTSSMLEACRALQLIAVSRGGPVNIDMQAARARGVPVVNAPGRNSTAVAEFTIGMILAQTRLLTLGHVSLSKGDWRGDLYRADRTGEELCNLTVGLIGYGHIGTKVVRLLKAFGCRIIVADPYATVTGADLKDGVEQVDLKTLLAQSDVVSLHARVTPETTGFMNAASFAQMKQGAYFINTARGPMVDYASLYTALTNGHLRGAGIETFDVEPPNPDSPLLRLPNVSLTPHIAGASIKTVKHAAAMVAEELRRFLSGEPPLNPS